MLLINLLPPILGAVKVNTRSGGYYWSIWVPRYNVLVDSDGHIFHASTRPR